MRNYVIINGVNSLTIQGLAINNLPPITKPMIRTQREEIDGRDGDIVTELGYSAYDKQIEIGLWGTYDINDIIKYFTGEGTIVFSNEEDKYYNFKILDQIDYQKLLKFKTATITFHCQPFKYPLEEEPVEAEITTLTGTGTTLTLNNTEEAPMSLVYKGNTLQNGEPTPDSPIPIQVVSGDNTIEICGLNHFDYEFAKDYSNTTLNAYRFIEIKNIKPNTTYSMYNYAKPDSTKFSNVFLAWDNQYSGISFRNLSAVDYGEIPTHDNAKLYLCTYAGSWTEALWTEFIEYFKNAMVVEGTDKSYPYEPYTGESYPISLGVENIATSYKASGSGYFNYNYDNSKVSKNMTLSFMPNITTTGATIYARPKDNGTLYTLGTISTITSGVKASLSFTLTDAQITEIKANTGGFFQIYRTNVDFTESSVSDIQLTEGNTPQYVSETPIELLKIGTYQDKIDKSSGKNSFNDTLRQGVTDYQTNVYNANNSTRITGTNWMILKAGTYTISGTTSLSKTLRESAIIFDTNDNFYNISNVSGVWHNLPYTFTTPIDIKIKLNMSYSDNSNITISEVSNVMIEESTTATEYEPYGTGWYVKKEIGKVVLNGSENWDYELISGLDTFKYLASDMVNQNNGEGLCNRYINRNLISTTGNGVARYGWVNQYIYFFTDTSIASGSISNWKTWLSSNNLETYYVLKTPTYTLIEDTTLINQLETIKKSYEGQTNITQENSDMPFELDVSVTFLTPMEINNIGNIYAKPILTIEGTGNIGVVLNDIQILDIDLTNNGKIAIDVPKLEAYNPDNDVLLNRNVTGDYMKLLINEGENTITFTGNVSSATLTNYIRWI